MITSSKNQYKIIGNLNPLANLSWNKNITSQLNLIPLIPLNIILLNLRTNLILLLSPSSKNNNLFRVMNRHCTSSVPLMNRRLNNSPVVLLQRVPFHCIQNITLAILPSNHIQKSIQMNQLEIELFFGHVEHLNELQSLLPVCQTVGIHLVLGSDIFLLSSQEKNPSIRNQNRSWKVWNLEGNYEVNKSVLLRDYVVQMEFGLVPLEPVDNFRHMKVGRVVSDPIEHQLNRSVQSPLNLIQSNTFLNHNLVLNF